MRGREANTWHTTSIREVATSPHWAKRLDIRWWYELEALRFASNTIVVLTADHGDIDGALRLHSKGSSTLLEQMNAKLNALIDQEVGEDVGQMLPGGVDGGWVETDAVTDV
jgi:hypothetical protein